MKESNFILKPTEEMKELDNPQSKINEDEKELEFQKKMKQFSRNSQQNFFNNTIRFVLLSFCLTVASMVLIFVCFTTFLLKICSYLSKKKSEDFILFKLYELLMNLGLISVLFLNTKIILVLT